MFFDLSLSSRHHYLCIRSEVVGRPLAALLANDGARVFSVDIDSIQVRLDWATTIVSHWVEHLLVRNTPNAHPPTLMLHVATILIISSTTVPIPSRIVWSNLTSSSLLFRALPIRSKLNGWRMVAFVSTSQLRRTSRRTSGRRWDWCSNSRLRSGLVLTQDLL